MATSWLGTTGCFTIAKQAYHEAVGAKGDVISIGGAPGGLSRFQSIEFKPATTSVSDRLCPPELRRAYDRCASQCAAKLAAYPGGDTKLTIASEILYFQKKGLLSGAFMLTRVRMSDGVDEVLDAMVRAESDAFRAGGEDDLARASCEALRAFLERGKSPPAARSEARP